MDALGLLTERFDVPPGRKKCLPMRRGTSAGAAILAVLVGGAVVCGDERAVRFNQDIRPILSEHCFTCHGPDARKRQAELRLDVEHDAKSELGSGAKAIVAREPDASEMIARIDSTDAGEQMPPPETGKPLSAEQIAILKRWIAEGAVWERHWSLEPIGRPAPPANADPQFVRNPIDAFVRQKQIEHGLSPSGPADRVTLLRRLCVDLTGLPPTPGEVARFLADEAPDAYERLADRLLASPHFGERLAIAWLDLVRYADSAGLYADQSIKVSPYRDYVIAAFNADMPFDRFTIEQLAGDLLPEKTTELRIASAYNRLGRMSTESGVQEKEYLSKYIAERVRNAGTTWLGVTLGCCECHDHKYDPFTARDFYKMAAFFADIKERGVYDKDSPTGIDWGPALQLGSPAQMHEFARLSQEIAALQDKLDKVKQEYAEPTMQRAAEQAAWEQSLEHNYDWKELQPRSAISVSGAACKVLPDKSIVVGGARPETDRYLIKAKAPLGKFTAVRLEVLPDPSLRGQGPGRAASGNFVLTGFTVSVDPAGTGNSQPVSFGSASATFEQTDAPGDIVSRVWSAFSAVRPDPKHPQLGWAVTDQTGVAQQAIFETEHDQHCHSDDELSITLVHQHGKSHALGRFRLSIADAQRPVETFGYHLLANIRNLLNKPAWRRNDEQKRELAEYYAVNVAPAGVELKNRKGDLEGQRDRLNHEIPSVLVVETVEPRPIRVLKRGDWQDDRGDLVEPGVPGALPALAEGSGRRTRLDLARWLVSAENPLTARVLVNRLWKSYFGAALSRKSDDLGSQGEWPTHPELLDWLARRLIDSGWSVKHIIRLMVTSETYRQESTASHEARERDPENRWLSHQSRFRLDAELVRDNALAVSGLLAPRIGGMSVRPYQPDGYWDILNKPPRVWTISPGDDLYRRGLYTHWQRQYLHPMLLAFDAPSREECAADRPRSNTPMQALALLNDPTFVEAARVLAERAVRDGGITPDERIGWLYRQALSRAPQPAEAAVLETLLQRHLANYRADPASAADLLTVGRSPMPANCDVVELAAWTNLARVILNLHDTIMRK
ncbi:MAG: DUF1553 domain-containing protein [Planctomycetaceae bacterium]|nr:DUF1553 domain-containing protein [Planctomycetaceae bacterium]